VCPRRVLRATVVLGAAAAALAAPAWGQSPGDSAYGWVETDDSGATVGAEQIITSPASGGTGGGGGGTKPCTWTPVEADLVGEQAELIFTRMPNAQFAWYLQECTNPDGSVTTTFIPVEVTDPGPAPDPEALRASAQEDLRLPTPKIAMSPPGEQVVHVASWLWVDGDLWRPHSSSASAGGVTATVTATPTRTVWDMGNGETVACDGPGVPYDPSRADAAQSTPCSYTYLNSSAGRPGNVYAVTVTVEWQLGWTVTGAPGGGALPGLTTSTSTAVPVGEVQALNQ
jgi:hypothetical protein